MDAFFTFSTKKFKTVSTRFHLGSQTLVGVMYYLDLQSLFHPSQYFFFYVDMFRCVYIYISKLLIFQAR